MGELSKLPNIGKIVEEQLLEVGISSADELIAIGAKAAWLKIQEIDELSKKIVITDKGQVLIEQKMKPLVDMEESVLASWTEEDRHKYLELIEKFKMQFEKEVRAYDKTQ